VYGPDQRRIAFPCKASLFSGLRGPAIGLSPFPGNRNGRTQPPMQPSSIYWLSITGMAEGSVVIRDAQCAETAASRGPVGFLISETHSLPNGGLCRLGHSSPLPILSTLPETIVSLACWNLARIRRTGRSGHKGQSWLEQASTCRAHEPASAGSWMQSLHVALIARRMLGRPTVTAHPLRCRGHLRVHRARVRAHEPCYQGWWQHLAIGPAGFPGLPPVRSQSGS